MRKYFSFNCDFKTFSQKKKDLIVFYNLQLCTRSSWRGKANKVAYRESITRIYHKTR